MRNGCTCLFKHFPPQGLLPGLVGFRPAARQIPGLAIIANQHNVASGGHANATRTVWPAVRGRYWRVPGERQEPIVSPKRHFFAVIGSSRAKRLGVYHIRSLTERRESRQQGRLVRWV